MKLTARHGAAGAGAAAVIALAVSFTGPFEGLVTHVYKDRLGTGQPWTYCYGDTLDPQFGHTYTKAECDADLAKKLGEFDTGLRACTAVPLPTKVEVAFLDGSYNLGVGWYCRNIAPLANAGRLADACSKLPDYDHAGGHVLKGLTIRREAERDLCFAGIAEGLPH